NADVLDGNVPDPPAAATRKRATFAFPPPSATDRVTSTSSPGKKLPLGGADARTIGVPAPRYGSATLRPPWKPCTAKVVLSAVGMVPQLAISNRVSAGIAWVGSAADGVLNHGTAPGASAIVMAPAPATPATRTSQRI